MTKYSCKGETITAKENKKLMKPIMKTTTERKKLVPSTLKVLMIKIIGKSLKSNEEVSHLILSMPVVSC